MGLLSVAAALFVVYVGATAIYRLCFSPLAKFPGPKLAAVTAWYEFYYDIIHRGQFIWKIQELHEKYGPIVRINPYEVHINDPDYYEQLYAPASKKRDKYEGWVVLAGAPTSTFATVSHDLHRLRRGALNPFFSKRSVAKLESKVLEKIENLCARFEGALQTQEVVRLDAAYMALTMDIITHYAFGESYNYLAESDYKLEWKETVVGGSANGAFLRQFPFALPILKATPLSWLQAMNPKAAKLVEWQHMVRAQVIAIVESSKGSGNDKTIFHALINSDLPVEEKSVDRLQDEGQTLIGAGSETTAKALSVITFYLNRDKAQLQRLRDELKQVMPTPTSTASWSELEQLPYLTAVINEGIRLMFGVTTRLPRVSRHEVMKYKDWEIPPGTPVSESNYFVHMNPEVFPEPEEYKPERWIAAEEAGFRLDRYLVSFSRGSRQCVGINLAYAELYLTVATVMRRFDLENFETDVDDVRIARDFFVGVPKLDSKGIRAQVVKTVDS